MLINPMFSNFKNPGSISVTATRRVAHSLSQKYKSLTKREGAWEAADKAALMGGIINASCTIAVAEGAMGAFATVASGPYAAGALGVVGLVLAAKNAYSNRESAHNTLMPYVWSYIDDQPPKPITEGNRSDVGAAAMSLISDGQAQQKLMDSKFKTAETAFNTFWNEYQEKSIALDFISNKRKEEKIIIAAYRSQDARQKFLDKAFAPNGAVYEFMRRLIHFGNYMQAAAVLWKVIQKDSTPLQDLAEIDQGVRDVRNKLANISARILRDNEAYKEVERIVSTG